MTAANWLEKVLPFLGMLIMAAVGSYFGSYLKKRAENRAVHADLGRLIEQVSAVSAATERIEAKSARSLRIHERQLDILAKLYRHMSDVRGFMQAMTKAFRVENEIQPEEYAKEVNKAMDSAHSAFVDGRLFIPRGLVAKCEDFFKAVVQGQSFFAWSRRIEVVDQAQRGEFWQKASDAAYARIPDILEQIENEARRLIAEGGYE
jgi:hypothetical protein